jgi:hypothetical protein
MLSISPEIWEQIEPQVRTLMVAAFDAGFDTGAGMPKRASGDPELAQLLNDTRRHWADGLAAMEAWRQAYVLPLPLAPKWLVEIQERVGTEG